MLPGTFLIDPFTTQPKVTPTNIGFLSREEWDTAKSISQRLKLLTSSIAPEHILNMVIRLVEDTFAAISHNYKNECVQLVKQIKTCITRGFYPEDLNEVSRCEMNLRALIRSAPLDDAPTNQLFVSEMIDPLMRLIASRCLTQEYTETVVATYVSVLETFNQSDTNTVFNTYFPWDYIVMCQVARSWCNMCYNKPRFIERLLEAPNNEQVLQYASVILANPSLKEEFYFLMSEFLSKQGRRFWREHGCIHMSII